MIKVDRVEYGYEGKAYFIKRISIFGIPFFTNSRSTQSKGVVSQFTPVHSLKPVIGFKNENKSKRIRKGKQV